jgi:prepilin-type N-terminal cleavage/methylation domain-containing protein
MLKYFYMKKYKKGFTLLEILLVVAAIAILAGIVIVALNPAKQLGDTRDAERTADVTTILNAVWQHAIDNDGTVTSEIDSDVLGVQIIGGTDAACAAFTCSGETVDSTCADLDPILVSDYLVGIPVDENAGGSDSATGYYINKETSGRITVGSCGEEQTATIEAQR